MTIFKMNQFQHTQTKKQVLKNFKITYNKNSSHSIKSQLDLMLSRQTINRFYNPNMIYHSERLSSIKKLQDLSSSLGICHQTFHQAVAFLDSILSLCNLEKQEIYLITLNCLFLAVKIKESKKRARIIITQILKHSSEIYEKTQFLTCEKVLVKILNYDLHFATPFDFLRYFCSKKLIFGSELDFYKILP